MGCRIGITTNPEERRNDWNRDYPGLKNWRIIAGPFTTKYEAQIVETDMAKQYGCVAAPGGRDVPGLSWYVYMFDF